MRKIFFILLLIFQNLVFSQNQYPKLSYTISYKTQYVAMKNYNNYLDNISSDLVKIDQRLKRVNKYDVNFHIEPSKWYNLGLFFEHSMGQLSFNPFFKILNPDLSVSLIEGSSKNKVISSSFGLSSSLFLNSLVKTDRTFIKNLNYGINLKIGYGFVKFLSETYSPIPIKYSVNSFIRVGNGLQLNSGVFVEYSLAKNLFEIVLGFTFGYQYYKTSDLRGPEGIKWGDPEYYTTPGLINLDFSGVYLGVYLKIRK